MSDLQPFYRTANFGIIVWSGPIRMTDKLWRVKIFHREKPSVSYHNRMHTTEHSYHTSTKIRAEVSHAISHHLLLITFTQSSNTSDTFRQISFADTSVMGCNAM
jgi:hypothetical protein